MERVLVVDGQPHVRQPRKLLLSLRGLEVVLAEGPSEALKAVEAGGTGGIGVAVQCMNFRASTTSGVSLRRGIQ